MERQLRWFVQLTGFYRILVGVAVAIGFVAVMTGIVEQNAVTFFIGMLWVVAGPGVVWLLARREDD